MKPLDRRVGIVVGVLVMLLLGLVAAVSLVGMPAPRPISEDASIGAHGPLALEFQAPLQPESLDSRLIVRAPDGSQVPGRVEISGTRLNFWPDQPLQEDQVYNLSLAAGVRALNGLPLRRGHSWSFTVRSAAVVYLSPPDAPEIWSAASAGAMPRQLTSTGGHVFDYEVSLDGEQIFFSAYNTQGGIDLWKIGRDGGSPEQLLPCQADWCFNPAISPDGLRLAYSRRQATGTPGQQPGLPHLWLLQMTDLSTDLLIPDPDVTGFQPVWSPDGRYLAFNDAVEETLHVADWQMGSFFSFQASLNGPVSWFSDSQRLFMSLIEGGGSDLRPFVQVFILDVPTQELSQALGQDDSLYDYSLPVWSPDDEWLAVALRRIDGGAGKGLWRMHLDGSQAERISPGDIVTNGAYSWSPDGSRLVFQRLALDSSLSRPEVQVWSAGSPSPVLVAENATLPRWLP